MNDFSVFDIIGPRMTGPSSSHTAGACKLAHIARHIAGNDIKRVTFTLYGSFAQTGAGHGTDLALIAGVLGMMPDDANIPHARECAEKAELQYELIMSDAESRHPNTARIHITDSNGLNTEVLGASIGGGNIRIMEINRLEVKVRQGSRGLAIPMFCGRMMN